MSFGRGEKLYNKVGRASLYLVFTPAASALLAGGACWAVSGASPQALPVLGGVSVAAALLGTAVSFIVRQKILRGLGGEILELLAGSNSEQQETSKETFRRLTSGDARAVMAELRQLLQQVREVDEAERRELEEALARVRSSAREVLESLDAAREKVMALAAAPESGEKKEDEKAGAVQA